MKEKIKKTGLKIALAVLGLNTFTACYGIPPGDYDRLPDFEQVQNNVQNNVQDSESEIEETSEQK